MLTIRTKYATDFNEKIPQLWTDSYLSPQKLVKVKLRSEDKGGKVGVE